jgi:hypothetical protein
MRRASITSLYLAALLWGAAGVFAQPAELELPPPVGSVALVLAGEGAPGLDVGIVVFDPGVPEDESSHSKLGIFPRIREAESSYMPVLLREALQDAGGWGVVRVLPEPQVSAELQVSGTILHSDGLRLALQIQARDATGRLWLDRIYLDETLESDYHTALEGEPGPEPYGDIYRQIANDLLEQAWKLGDRQLQAIGEVGLLRYAAALSPEAFSGYLAEEGAGQFSLTRLPAEGDPMMARVQRIRNQEYLFIDTVDEQYLNLHEQMALTYFLWRQYGREQAIYIEDYHERQQGRSRQGRPGSFAAMQQTYNAYRGSKIQEQDLDDMAGGFRNEVAPTVMEISGRVFQLDGTLGSQYEEWQAILREIFALETGLPPG